MPVAFDERHAGDVPLLVAVPDDAPRGLPVVLWLHGFRADAAANRGELARLAAGGFVAVGVDAVGHGRRRPADVEARLAAAPRALPVMLDLARATARELPDVVRALAADPRVDAGRVSLAGVSMGGYLAYRAALDLTDAGLPPRAVVALLGSPEWPDADAPHRAPERFEATALLSIVAGRDESVPPDAARRFHARLAARHPTPARARIVELADAPHLMGAAQWETAMGETAAWLARWGR